MKPQQFWAVEAGTLYVCMNCLDQVYWKHIPRPNCPRCHAVSSYEAFQLEQVQDWGFTSLVKEAEALVLRHAENNCKTMCSHDEVSQKTF
jgi:hypothetical protein